ncbi:MAG: hypothetical protein ACYC7A_20240 [Thermoanaerobaculia bacterium]
MNRSIPSLFALVSLVSLIACRPAATSHSVIFGAEVAPAPLERPMAVRVNSEANYRGIYTGGFETSSFVPCGSDETWWVEWRGAVEPGDGQFLVTIGAVVTDVGRYGHLGQYHRRAEVTRVDVITTEAPRCE